MDEVRLNDIGVKIKVTVKDIDGAIVDLSTSSTKQFFLEKPTSHEVLTKTASFETDGSDGIIYYITQDGDLDEAGVWGVQIKVVIGTYTFKSNIVKFRVTKVLA